MASLNQGIIQQLARRTKPPGTGTRQVAGRQPGPMAGQNPTDPYSSGQGPGYDYQGGGSGRPISPGFGGPSGLPKQGEPGGKPYPTVRKNRPEGLTAYYDDSWQQLMASMQGGEDQGQFMQRLLSNFRGNVHDLQDFMEMTQQFQPQLLRNNPAYQYLQDFQNIDRSMEAYGVGAGNIARQSAAGTRAAQQQLGAAGLGRSTAMAGLAQRQALGSSQAQANLYSNLWQQHVANTSRYAAQAFDMDRQITQMALGQELTPRTGEGGGSNAGLYGGIGAVLGGVVGSLVPGLGTAAGATLGAGLGTAAA